MAAVGDIKLPDLITKWMEVQKGRAGLESSEPLNVDAVNLTLLLKSMGLRLESLDFETEKSNVDTLSINIKCNKSGMAAKMSYDLISCTCPQKTYAESSFWEVQATGPRVFSKFKNNTSSNLLPEVTESCALVSKAMLSNLLEFYQSSIQQAREEKELALLRSPLKSPMPNICVTSPGLSVSPFSTPPAEGKCMSMITSKEHICYEPTTAPPSTPVVLQPPPPAAQEEVVVKMENLKSSTDDQQLHDTRSNSSSENLNINNRTREMINTDNKNTPLIDGRPVVGDTMADDISFTYSDQMKALITSSPNVKAKRLVQETSDSHFQRDLNVINSLQQARTHIDAALLFMKLNNRQDFANTSAVTTTPQSAASTASARRQMLPPRFMERSGSLVNINRRMSLPGGPGLDAPRIPKTTTTGTIRKKAPISSLTSTNGGGGPGAASAKLNLNGRADTPRPTVAHVKSVAALRKTASALAAASSFSTSTRQDGTGQRKPPVGSSAASSGVKPGQKLSGSGRIGNITRSSSTTLLHKK